VSDAPLADKTAAQAAMFGNRLEKGLRRGLTWARRHDVFAWRVYDCDIPEVPLSVDRYADEAGDVHAILAYYEGRFPHDEAWFAAMLDETSRVLGVDPSHVRMKRRARQEGDKQYERLGESDRRFVVREDGLRFWVNLDDYLDTGLFLDHRVTRGLVRAESAGKRMLNLFAYTGAFSVHAASGGARTTTTVDLSQTYCDWAQDNLTLNGFGGAEHRVLRADVLRWLDEDTGLYDLAVVDPPTFSNSKRMVGIFDVQRDHPTLLEKVQRRMAPGGVVWFSTNFRRFKPDERAMARLFAEVVEVSSKTVPLDFRDKKIHRCWRLVRGH
jgi:23S rRNA G2069 N7-methylase RlmK/C1962 C5-methylase RlmI